MSIPSAQRPAIFITLCLWFSGAGWAATDEPPLQRLPLQPSHLQAEINHYGVYIIGKKIGWMSEAVQIDEFEGLKVYAVDLHFMEKLLNAGEAMTSVSRDVEYFATEAPYSFIAAISTSEQNGYASTTEIRRSADGDGEYVATIRSGKSERTKELGKLDYTLGDALTPQVWCGLELAVGDTIKVRELNLTDLEVRANQYTVTGVLPAGGAGEHQQAGRSGRYKLDYFDEVDKTRATYTVDARGVMLLGEVSGSVELKLESADEAKKLEANLDLFEASLVKIDESLGDPTQIREMVLEITGDAADAIVDSPNQNATYDAVAKRLLLKVGRDHAVRAVVSAEDRAKALEETSAYPTKDPQIRALVDRAIGRATRPKARIKRLLDFVDSFVVDDYGNEPLSVNDIIETQRGDCTEHSQLFVTMARAAGIPAREVSGFIYGEDSGFTFGGHAWCEVEVDGHWHPVDPTWGETMINATHIRISGERPSSEEMGLYMSGLTFRILSTKDRSGVERQFAKPSSTQ